ncbi:LuxR C-terminal-related transcriptional regulator [Serratia quinivorans]|uniref:LuxR C-terminal-related transcriptional regulator n=1 Tax=Serratia quinivorans TaxID=137545 RepID=UPI003F9E4536
MKSFVNERVAVISPCHMFQAGIRALLSTYSTTLSWHCKHVASVKPSLNIWSVNLLIISLNVKQVDLPLVLQFIQQVRVSQPQIRLMIILDSAMPYLVSLLRRLKVACIMNLADPLVVWQTQLQRIMATDHGLSPDAYCDMQEGDGATLSVLERRVINLVVQEFSVDEIAVLLMRSGKTISCHKVNAMHKLGMRNYAQLVTMKSLFIEKGQSSKPGTPLYMT